MADVTISQLTQGIPSSSALLPYSQGGNTLVASPSGIVSASPGTVIQTVSYSNLTSLAIGDGPGQNFTNVSITPKFASSKILVTMGTIAHRNVGNSSDYYEIRLLRNDNYETPLTLIADAALYQSFGNGQREFYCTTYLDNPNTTNTTTYRGFAKRMSGTQGLSYAVFNMSNTGYATLQEIAG